MFNTTNPKLFPLLFETTLSTNPLLAQAQTTIVQSVVSELKEIGIVLDSKKENSTQENSIWEVWEGKKQTEIVFVQNEIYRNKQKVVINLQFYSYRKPTWFSLGNEIWITPLLEPIFNVNEALNQENQENKIELEQLEAMSEDERIDLYDTVINKLVASTRKLYENYYNRTTLFYNVDTGELTAE